MSRRIAAALLAVVVMVAAFYLPHAGAQTSQNEEFNRRAKNRVQPFFPDLAKKMNITGTVKIEVTVAPNGTVRAARIVGGHPLLANAALDAAKKWRFEPAATESTGVIEFKFEPR